MNDDKKNIELHVAGATVRPETPFQSLPTFKTDFEITKEFIDKWVMSFYMNNVETSTFQKQYQVIKEELNEEIVEVLLGDFNWRTRKVGAIFTIVKNYFQFEEIIGNHLLKSEVCYAGRYYALALAHINKESSINYLVQYLEYYLTRHDLQFDQIPVMQTLVYLDRKNETKLHNKLLPLWHDYISPINRSREESMKKHPEAYPKNFKLIDLESGIEVIQNKLQSYQNLRET